MSASTKRKAALYLEAAERIETKTECGCCGAINNSGQSASEFRAIFKPDSAGINAYWMGLCKCYTDENIGFRVLALCFMATLAEAGDICIPDSNPTRNL